MTATNPDMAGCQPSRGQNRNGKAVEPQQSSNAAQRPLKSRSQDSSWSLAAVWYATGTQPQPPCRADHVAAQQLHEGRVVATAVS
jgi:hypothetical protein